MDEKQLAKLLIEDVPVEQISQKINVLANRIMLQISTVPALQQHMVDMSVKPDDEGGGIIELEFMQLPEEVIPDLKRLISVEYFKSYRFLRFVKDGQSRTGIEIKVDADEIPGEAENYAF